MDPTTTDTADPGTDRVDDFLAHFGTKGMRWGVRRAVKGAAGGKKKEEASSGSSSGGSSGGAFPKGGTKTPGRLDKPKPITVTKDPAQMTDAQLRNAINRIQMQRQYAQLTAPPPTRGDRAKAMASEILVDVGKTQAKNLLNALALQQMAKAGLPVGKGGKGGKKEKEKEKEDATPEAPPKGTPKPPAGGSSPPPAAAKAKAKSSAQEFNADPMEYIRKMRDEQFGPRTGSKETLEAVYDPKTRTFTVPKN